MGAWGAGLFSDDTALDVKGDWEELYKRFGEPEQTTRELLANHDADDEDLGPVVVLALAMCQWKYGCLQPDIKARALKVVRSGAGLHLWEDPKDLARRKVVYTRVAETLQQPQPARKRVKQLTPLEPTPFKPGQLLKYRCWDGEFVLLWVVDHYRYKGDKLPRCAALDWKGRELPNPAKIRALQPVVCSTDRFSRQWEKDFAAEHGHKLPPRPPGLEWTGYAPREVSRYGFDPSRVEVVAGDWRWNLQKQGGGPQVPSWIEVGPCVAIDLSTTIAFKGTLPRSKRPDRTVLPKRPRPLAAPSGPPRPLGVEVELPKGRASKRSDLLTLKRSRHQPMPGDIFVVNVGGGRGTRAGRWVVGRVILNDAHFAAGPADILVYFYRQEFERTADITLPMRLDDLAIPPRAAHANDWQRGEFFHIANSPLLPCELPARHVFGPGFDSYYRDAYSMPTQPPAKDELIGDLGIGAIGMELAEALRQS